MTNENYLFYKERKLSGKTNSMSVRIDENILNELKKHLQEKYGEVNKGMKEIILDYMYNTPLVRTNIPIMVSLAIPKDITLVDELTIYNFDGVDDNDKIKDKLYVLSSNLLSIIVDDGLFNESISYHEIKKDLDYWLIFGVNDSLDDFINDKHFSHSFSDYNSFEEHFANDFLNEDLSNYYELDDVYVVNFLLNNYLDSKSDGSYGKDGKHYGALYLEKDGNDYYIIMEFKLSDFRLKGYSIYFVTKDTFEDLLYRRNQDLFFNYQMVRYFDDERIKSELIDLASDIRKLKKELNEKELLYGKLLQESKEPIRKRIDGN